VVFAAVAAVISRPPRTDRPLVDTVTAPPT